MMLTHFSFFFFFSSRRRHTRWNCDWSSYVCSSDLKKDPAAVKLGRKGGKEIAKRGPEYFRQLQARRKKREGGRPSKSKKSLRIVRSSLDAPPLASQVFIPRGA